MNNQVYLLALVKDNQIVNFRDKVYTSYDFAKQIVDAFQECEDVGQWVIFPLELDTFKTLKDLKSID